MIYQVQIGQTLVGGNPGGTYEVPFYGRYKVRLIKIDYAYNSAGGILQNLLRITSNTLLNNTPLQSGFLFINSSNCFYNGLVINEDLEINGRFDIALSRVSGVGAWPSIGVNGGYVDCVITLDFEKIVKDQSMVGYSNNKPLINF